MGPWTVKGFCRLALGKAALGFFSVPAVGSSPVEELGSIKPSAISERKLKFVWDNFEELQCCLPCDVMCSYKKHVVSVYAGDVCIHVFISIRDSVHVFLCVSYWFNFPLYVTVNECYLNKATEAHKSAWVEIVGLVKFPHSFWGENELMGSDGDASWEENSSTSLCQMWYISSLIRTIYDGPFCDITLRADLKYPKREKL